MSAGKLLHGFLPRRRASLRDCPERDFHGRQQPDGRLRLQQAHVGQKLRRYGSGSVVPPGAMFLSYFWTNMFRFVVLGSAYVGR